MAWKYSQATGVISHDGNSLTPAAYSGIGPGKNNPSAQMQESIQHLPCVIDRCGRHWFLRFSIINMS